MLIERIFFKWQEKFKIVFKTDGKDSIEGKRLNEEKSKQDKVLRRWKEMQKIGLRRRELNSCKGKKKKESLRTLDFSVISIYTVYN